MMVTAERAAVGGRSRRGRLARGDAQRYSRWLQCAASACRVVGRRGQSGYGCDIGVGGAM